MFELIRQKEIKNLFEPPMKIFQRFVENYSLSMFFSIIQLTMKTKKHMIAGA